MRAPLAKLLGASLLLGSLFGGCATQRDVAVTDMTAREVTREFSDANVAAVLSEINSMEIESSRLALERSQNANVRQYAQRMIREHTALQQAQNQMLEARGMMPEHNALSLTMTRNLEPTMAQLRQLSGPEFDRAYIALQKSAHRQALTTIDTTLVPSTRDPGLRQFVVQQVRPRISRHLQWIEQIDAVRAGA